MAGIIPLTLDLHFAEEFGVYHMDGEMSPQSKVAPLRVQQRRSMKTMKRTTVESLAPMRVLPHTTAEWKKLLAEVKREYINRRFRPCSNRCHEVLDSVRDSDVVEKAYIIFLRFYAASALEMQVRSLHHTSAHRSNLLRQARDHYRHASDLARAEHEAIASLPVPAPCSPAGSVSSGSTMSSRTSSPVPSLDRVDTSQPVTKPKKRVQFCDPVVAEPVIRPDSPTLGFDEWLGRSSPDLIIATEPELLRHVNEEPPALHLGAKEDSPPDEVPAGAEVSQDPEQDTFVRARSIERYCTLLSGIRTQIATHLAAVEADITAALNPPLAPPKDDEMRAMQLRARIERLRAEGWPRRRFDERRYEALRENATADMMA